MTKKNKLKKGVRNGKVLLIAGLLLVALFALTLFNGFGISGSLLTPTTAKAAQSDYWGLETVCANYVNGEYNAFDVTITKEGNASFLTVPKVTADDVAGYTFSEFYLCVKNPNGLKSYKYRSNPDVIAPFFLGDVRLNLADYITFGDTGVYSFFIIYGYFTDFSDMGVCRLSNISAYEYSVSQALPPDPTKEGHTFSGWYTDEECTQKYNGTTITGDLTLYAGWTINRYAVNFDTAGGAAVSAQTVDWSTPVTLSTPERVGYSFVGWFLPNGTQYTDQPIKADTILTAHWQIKVCTITFMVGDEVYETFSVDYGTSLVDALQAAGLTFYTAMSADGEPLGRATKITEETTLLLSEMSQAEKVGTWIGDNMWALWSAVGLLGALILALAVAIALARK